MTRFLPVIAVIVIIAAHFFAQVFLAYGKVLPMLYELDEMNDGSAERRAQAAAYTNVRRFGSYCRGLALLFGVLYIFVRTPAMNALMFIPPVLYLVIEIFLFLMVIQNRSMKYIRKGVMINALVEIVFAVILFAAFHFTVPGGISALSGLFRH